jgi:hypothetical protein
MPDREFIHSTHDIATALTYALDSGMTVIVDHPQQEPRPHILARKEIITFDRGVFLLSQPNWQFGARQMTKILGGAHQGLYSMSPRVNQSPITIYFQGERIDRQRRRLGSGVLSFHRDWLELPSKVVRKTPADVQIWFDKLASHLFSKTAIKAGAHRYHLCRGVVADPQANHCLPPFDFIPWMREF